MAKPKHITLRLDRDDLVERMKATTPHPALRAGIATKLDNFLDSIGGPVFRFEVVEDAKPKAKRSRKAKADKADAKPKNEDE